MPSQFKKLGAFGATILFCAITQGATKGVKEKPGIKKNPAGKVTLSQTLRAQRHERRRAQRGAFANNKDTKDLMSSFKKDVNNIHYRLGIRNHMLTLFISGTGVVTKEDIDELDGQLAQITAVNVLDNTIEIGERAFSSINDLRRVEGRMRSIGVKAFYSCDNLTDVEFSEDLTEIKEAAFEDCQKLKEIIIPKNITSIEGHAFCGCENLEKVIFKSSNIEVIREATFQETGLKEITIPNGVKIIGSFVFDKCEKLTKVTLPPSCYYLGDYAFANCTLLREINLEHVNEIADDYVFCGCDALNESARSRIDELGGDDFGS